MILGVGVDLVSLQRFEAWIDFSDKKLSRIFHQHEIEQFKSSEQKVTFLASRFAVKEAFFKALSAACVRLHYNQKQFSFLSLAPSIFVQSHEQGIPLFCFDNSFLQELFNRHQLVVHLSLSHEKEQAIAYVLIEQAFNPATKIDA